MHGKGNVYLPGLEGGNQVGVTGIGLVFDADPACQAELLLLADFKFNG